MKSTLTIIASLAFAGAAFAAPQSFDFKDPKGVNNAVFNLDAPLEAITGSASGVSGTVTFDPAKPGDTKGKIVIAASSLQVPNSMMKTHMHGAQWLDVTKFPEITFEAKEFKNVKTEATITSADVTGSFTLRGVTKEITVPVKLTYLKDKLGDRVQGLKGDLLVIRANFTIKRTDYGINPSSPTDKVAEEINLSLNIAGAAAAK